MKRDYIDFQARSVPVGYLITFRCYGTWLHGDERGSVDRNHRAYGAPLLPSSTLRTSRDQRLMKQPPVVLDVNRSKAVELGIRELCERRNWPLFAINVRSNHVQAVTSASDKPSVLLAGLKAGATKR